MLKHVREKHLKRILWALTIIIVPSFSFFGVFSYMSNKQHDTVAEIGKTKIGRQEFNEYLHMAELNERLAPNQKENRSYEELNDKAWEYLLLHWKAKQEKITITDQEVVEHIKKLFSQDNKFDQERYNRVVQRGLKLEPRAFEEYMRKFLQISKLIDAHVKVNVTDEEIKELYLKYDQKVKFGYLNFSYDNYAKNFKKLTIEQQKNKALEAAGSIIQEANKLPANELAAFADNKLSNYKETDYLTPNQPIADLAISDEIKNELFALKLKQIYPKPIVLANGVYVFALTALAEFDQKDYDTKKTLYEYYILQQKRFIEEMKFLANLEKEAQIKIYLPGKANAKTN